MESRPIKNNKKGNLPYTVPEDFFKTLESNILKQTVEPMQTHHRRKRDLPAIKRALLAIAASVLLFFTIHAIWEETATAMQGNIEQAFDNLSQDDQAYLLETYQDDIFLNQQYNN